MLWVVGNRDESIDPSLPRVLAPDEEGGGVSMLGRALAFIRRSGAGESRGRGRGDGAGHDGSRLALARVRNCYVCGGDPRHLCRRCRELAR